MSVKVEQGAAIAFGGSNARVADCFEGDISGFDSIRTPGSPNEFFSWTARHLLESAHKGNSWLVAGFPGPVSIDGRTIGPFANIKGLDEVEYDLLDRLNEADPEVGRTLEQGFTLLTVNDGPLAAQAVAARVGEHKYDKSAALIIGTGVGAGVAIRDKRYADVHRVDTNPLEIGHLLIRYSGPALKRRAEGIDPKNLPADHPLWQEEGEAAFRMATFLGLMSGVELVVPTGGVGAGASDKFNNALINMSAQYALSGNNTQKKFTPDIKLIPPNQSQEFELYGAEGVMRDYLTK